MLDYLSSELKIVKGQTVKSLNNPLSQHLKKPFYICG